MKMVGSIWRVKKGDHKYSDWSKGRIMIIGRYENSYYCSLMDLVNEEDRITRYKLIKYFDLESYVKDI
jgi:hypothetical protein